MKKNLLLRLCLMMTVMLSFYSCSNEDFYASAENQKQEIISKSLWKEDALFTQRIYDHFQKSFMSTKADQQNFFAEHGTPVWEYTMTMGFKRNQLFVPLIKNNQVIGVMRVQREDKKAFYAFTKDGEALQFFDLVMYNRNNDKLLPQKDEKLNESISSKGGYTWSCTKRSVITGYHMDGDIMVMETSFIDVCKYTYTGVKPPVDHLEVYTDGMDSGGGDGNEEEEENEGNPCEEAKMILEDPVVKAKIKVLEEQSKKTGNDRGEKAFLYTNDNGSSDIIGGGDHEVNLAGYTGYKGIYHNHTPYGTKMLAPYDIRALYRTVVYQQNSATAHEAFVGMVAYENCNCPPDNVIYHHYLLQFNGDFSQTGAIANLNDEEMEKLRLYFNKIATSLLKTPSLRNGQSIASELNTQGLEQLFFKTLEKMNIEPNQIILQKVEKDGTINNINLNSDGTTTPAPCPK